MLSQQDQEIRRNVPDPLFAGGSHFCGSGAGDETMHHLAAYPCTVAVYVIDFPMTTMPHSPLLQAAGNILEVCENW